MPDAPAQLLADTDPMKLISGLIVIAFWIIGALITAATKKKENAQRQQTREHLEAVARARGRVASTPQPVPPPVPGYSPPPLAEGVRMRVPDRLVRPLAKKPKQAKPTPPPRVAPKRVVSQVPIEEEVSHRTTTDVPPPSARPQPAVVAAAAIHRWLRPQTLRQQFIVTELLQPPLSLRE
jgi:Na+-transporting methylmalonyl-CoA/oxaloacetate decarboxylase gamma subunit